MSYHSTCYRSPHNPFLGNSHSLFTPCFSLWVSFSVHSPQEIFCILHTHKLVPCYWYLAVSANALVSDSADLMDNCVFTNYVSLVCFVVLDLLQDIVTICLSRFEMITNLLLFKLSHLQPHILLLAFLISLLSWANGGTTKASVPSQILTWIKPNHQHLHPASSQTDKQRQQNGSS